MSNSENNYYLKDGLLYKLTGAAMYRVSSEDVIDDSSKSALLIDDSYFFILAWKIYLQVLKNYMPLQQTT